MYKSTNILVFSVILSLLAMACSSKKSDSNEQTSSSASETELREAPNFEVTTIEGNTVSLQQSLEENKPMVVYFTASWCPVCAKNWPVLSKVYPDYKDKLNFVAIGIDPTDTRDVMTKLAKEEGFTFPTTWGHPDIMVDFGVESQATTVGINREGNIVFQKNKTALSEEEYRELFDQIVS
ncbi:redoxin domain-containing protein [Aliifodinibius sp. S!AR15-10]|uniref:peroxiredoxin family protein n=1 Tax=Aliifodinibius sp. S!AR15-10 TaxID=2950437 RepID=UPI00285C833B|nr:redoxin domain-containing protein [Aliifodinibius sp. S!AR15-10]MDR8392935.1 redoxin domain-containing protein [Aliifodinibius sp. S!AR15-10]